MHRILLVDANQPIVQDERYAFTRIDPGTETLSQICSRVALAATEHPYDLITLAHRAGSLGFALTAAISPDQRGRIVIVSQNPVLPFMKDAYALLGVTMFCGREDEYARFLNEWAGQHATSETSADPDTT
jgi:hypothetical protein